MVDIVLQRLTRTYGRGTRAVQALTDVTFDVARGDLIALVGPSGSGKTTLLRLIAGLDTPSRGTIELGGRPAAALPPHERSIGMVFQQQAVYPHLTVRENVAFGLRAAGRTQAPSTASLLRTFEITELASARPYRLSGGQRQRVALARSLARGPRRLLLDEPLTGLDGPLRHRVRDTLIQHIRQHQVATVWVTHDVTLARHHADRVAVLVDGAILQLDTPGAIRARPQCPIAADLLVPGGWLFLEGSAAAAPVFEGPDIRIALPARHASVIGRARQIGIPVRDLTTAASASPLLTATVTATREDESPQIQHVFLRTRQGVPLHLQRPLHDRMKPGQTVALTCNPENVQLFDAGPAGRNLAMETVMRTVDPN